jgi:sulfur carrier protein ThiS
MQMLIIRVKLYGLLRPYHPGPNRSVPIALEVAPQTTIADVIVQLNLPKQHARGLFVNGELRPATTPLNDGDEVLLMSNLVGG